jgi:hypothetical protein
MIEPEWFSHHHVMIGGCSVYCSGELIRTSAHQQAEDQMIRLKRTADQNIRIPAGRASDDQDARPMYRSAVFPDPPVA